MPVFGSYAPVAFDFGEDLGQNTHVTTATMTQAAKPRGLYISRKTTERTVPVVCPF